MKYITYLFFMI